MPGMLRGAADEWGEKRKRIVREGKRERGRKKERERGREREREIERERERYNVSFVAKICHMICVIF